MDVKGLGPLQPRDIHEGERLIAEVPLALAHAQRCSQQVRRRSFKQLIAESPAQHASFLALSHSTHHGDAQRRTMMGTWLTNALPIATRTGTVTMRSRRGRRLRGDLTHQPFVRPQLPPRVEPGSGARDHPRDRAHRCRDGLTIATDARRRPCTERQERLQAQFGYLRLRTVRPLRRRAAAQRRASARLASSPRPAPHRLCSATGGAALAHARRHAGRVGAPATPRDGGLRQDKSPAGRRSAELAERARAACLVDRPRPPQPQDHQSFLAIVGQFDKAPTSAHWLARAAGSGAVALRAVAAARVSEY